jgi:hypothetical protein
MHPLHTAVRVASCRSARHERASARAYIEAYMFEDAAAR